MDLSTDDKEVIKFLILLNDRIIFLDLNNWFLIVDFKLSKSNLRDHISTKIESLHCSPRYRHSLFRNIIVTIPFACIVTEILVSTQ